MTHAPVVIYPAKSITTMNPLAPTAEVIAVAGDRLTAVGSSEAVTSALKNAGREFTVDTTFADAALIPGLIEAHSHITSTGSFYRMPAYLGAYPRLGPNGMLDGCDSKQAALAALRAVAPSVTGPLTAWGYDPTLIEGGAKITVKDLDAVDSTRPVAVMNMSGHVTYANSAALRLAGYDDSTDKPGVVRDADGKLTGELDELPAEMPLWAAIAAAAGQDASALLSGIAMVADLSHKRGLTTISDLLTQSPDEAKTMSAYAHSDGAK
ncbi:MAG: amidohydrolase family protein, partial [Actinomycetes bacterium]